MGFFPDSKECDICGAPLDPEDELIHLCKICQGLQFDEWQSNL